MKNSLFKYGLTKWIFVFVLSGVILGAVMTLLICSSGVEEGEIHSLPRAFGGFALMIVSMIKSGELFNVGLTFNRTRASIFRTAVKIELILSLSVCTAELLTEFIFSKAFKGCRFTTFLELLGAPHSFCSEGAGIAAACVYEMLVFIGIAGIGLFGMALISKLPTKVVSVMWIVFIILIDAFVYFGRDVFGSIDLAAGIKMTIPPVFCAVFYISAYYFIRTFDQRQPFVARAKV